LSYSGMALVESLVLPYRRLRCRQYCNGDPVRRRADIVKADAAAEFYRPRIPSVFAADSYLNVLLYSTGQLHSHSHQPAHSLGIDSLERVDSHYPLLQVERKKLAFCIFPAKTKCRLGKIVGAKADEIYQMGDVVCHKARTHYFNHASELYPQLHPVPMLHFALD